jgi:hypothetical protein
MRGIIVQDRGLRPEKIGRPKSEVISDTRTDNAAADDNDVCGFNHEE